MIMVLDTAQMFHLIEEIMTQVKGSVMTTMERIPTMKDLLKYVNTQLHDTIFPSYPTSKVSSTERVALPPYLRAYLAKMEDINYTI